MKIILENIEDEQQREQYIKNIILQYQEATQKNNSNTTSTGFRRSFLEWSKERRKIREFYKEQLKELGIDVATPETAEVNKGVNDTLVYGENARVITPYPYNMYGQTFQSKIIKSKFVIVKNAPFTPIHQLKGIKTFITHNPYNETDIQSWSELFNSNHYNVAVGIYGKCYEMDRMKKKRMLEELKKLITTSYQSIEIEKSEMYSYILTNNLTRKAK